MLAKFPFASFFVASSDAICPAEAFHHSLTFILVSTSRKLDKILIYWKRKEKYPSQPNGNRRKSFHLLLTKQYFCIGTHKSRLVRRFFIAVTSAVNTAGIKNEFTVVLKANNNYCTEFSILEIFKSEK